MTAGRSLTHGLIESHLAKGAGRGAGPDPGAEIALRADHLVMDDEAALLTFQWFETQHLPGGAVELVLVCAEGSERLPAFEAGEHLRYVESAARRYGAHFSRPGNGSAHHVYGARFSSPGRLLLACAEGAAAAGALGTLVLPVGELELAAALAGAPHAARMPEVWAIRLAGTLPPGVGVHDLVLALLRVLPGNRGRPVVLEYTGPGVAALAQEDRFTVAGLGAALGLPPALFPSDEQSRRWLRAQGREPDWKAQTGDPEPQAGRVVEMHLDALEPQVLRIADGADPVRVVDAAGLPIRRVVVGAGAGLAELLRVAERLSGRRVAPGVDLAVVPGSRSIRAALGACGALPALVEAGARILDSETRLAFGPRTGATLLFGASAALAARARPAFRVGSEVAAASALAGQIADARGLAPPRTVFPGPERMAPCEVVAPRPEAARRQLTVERGSAIRPLPSADPLAGTLRGVVLARLPDRVTTELVLPHGPRVWRHRGDPAAIAEHLYAGLDPMFAARARALGGGFVVAGAEYGHGPHRPLAILAMLAVGVRVVIAQSFAPRHRAEMIRYGVLPLRPGADQDAGGPAVGDELEIPGLPEALEHNKPLVIRNLTRGTQLTLHHDLTTRQVDRVCAGGLLACAVAAVPAAGERAR